MKTGEFMPRANAIANYGSMPDHALARCLAGGDQQALRFLMRRCNQSLYRAARAILKDDAEAEDAVQDGYLAAWRAIGGFRSDAKLSTWLTRIVVNEALRRLRKTRRGAAIISLAGNMDLDDDPNQAAAEEPPGSRPEDAAMRAQTRRLVEATIDNLPDTYRAVFVLRALDEMSVEETAQCLSIPAATVRSRFFRARALLRAALSTHIDVALEDAFSFAGERCDRIVEGDISRLQDPNSDMDPTPPAPTPPT
jgi:RNA polymerase sigma-70 factor (ECF subfamily)